MIPLSALPIVLLLSIFVSFPSSSTAFLGISTYRQMSRTGNDATVSHSRNSFLQMNVFEDAFRFFTNLDKEASAKHILMTGTDAPDKLTLVKKELETVPPTDLSTAFSELASKVSR